MTRDNAVRRYGSHIALAKVTGYSRQAHDLSNHLRPMAQIKVFIDTDGELKLDDDLNAMIDKVLAIKIKTGAIK